MNADVIATGAERVFVRGRAWNVIGRTAASDCTAVHLREIGSEREQTLLIPFDRLRPLDSRRRPRLVRPRRWLHELDRERLRLHPFGGLRAAASAPVRLLPYQLEPAIAMLRDGTARLLIADKVGLGKTIQAGLILLELSRLHEQCRALVIVPAGLREQWIDELSRRLGLTATLADSAWIRTARSERPVHVNPWSLPGIYVSSHDLVKRPEVLRPLEDVTWDIVVVDEAHVATSRSDRRAAVHAIAARSRRVVLLSATPNSGDRLEFEALCAIGSLPSDRSPVVLFERSRAAAGEHRSRRTRILSVGCTGGERRMHEMLRRYCSRLWREANLRGDERARLVAIVLRKRALSSAASLAVSVERRLTLLSGAQIDAPRQLALPLSLGPDEDALEDDEPVAGLAVPGLADADSERRSLSSLASAAHNAARDESKTRFLVRLLARLGRRGVGSALIFTEYRDTLARLVERLTIAGHGVSMLHGGLTASERSSVQRQFNDRGGILLATDAAAEGLNLHHRCHLVIHYELPWNPTRLEQRCGRIDRLGQTARVHELALVADHTAERLVVSPLLARLRSAGPGQKAMLDALTESRVAAAVMNGADVEVDDDEAATLPPTVVQAPGELALLAAREVSRLEEARILIGRSQRASKQPPRLAISTCRGSMHVARGLYLFLALDIRELDGLPLHSDLMAVRIDFDRAGKRPDALKIETRLLEILSDLTTRSGFINSLTASRATQELRRIGDLDALRRRRQRERWHAIRDGIGGGQPAASRMLVQQGLFDRRSARAAAARAARQTRQLEAITEEDLAPEPSLAMRTEIVAALLVLDRP